MLNYGVLEYSDATLPAIRHHVMQLRWSHAFVHVTDMEAMVDFYTNVLGFEVTDRGDVGGNEFVFLSQVETDHHQLGFSATREQSGRSNNVAHFAFRVDDLDTVKTMHQVLTKDDRVTSIMPITHGNAWSVYFNDPEDNGIEIFCDTPWHVAQPQGGPWDPTMATDDIVNATQTAFEGASEFGPINDYYEERSSHLTRREGGQT
ncbi:MAG: VOC family protein [Pseudomonadota bacterium]|nr:VOC family protein [Pseudomonadota bacterium]